MIDFPRQPGAMEVIWTASPELRVEVRALTLTCSVALAFLGLRFLSCRMGIDTSALATS